MVIILGKFGIIRKRDGFTLVELIVVLVIIGILLALVIPNLTGYIDKAQATACHKNRVELEKIYRYDTLLAEAEGKTVTIATLLASENGTKLTCPSGGTYSYNNATGHFDCSNPKHNDGVVSINPIAAGVLDHLPANGTKSIDSGAAGDFTKAFLKDLTDAGINLENMNINSWSYSKDNGIFYWTSADISKLQNKDEVVVFKYNTRDAALDADGTRLYYKGTYSVWKMQVKTTTPSTGTSYNVIGGTVNEIESSKAYTADSDEKKDFDFINKLYESEMEEYYKTYPQAKK